MGQHGLTSGFLSEIEVAGFCSHVDGDDVEKKMYETTMAYLTTLKRNGVSCLALRLRILNRIKTYFAVGPLLIYLMVWVRIRFSLLWFFFTGYTKNATDL